MIYKKGYIILLILFFCVYFINSLNFKIKTKNEKELLIKAIFDMGFSAKGIADGIGTEDYESVFFKPAFHIQDFGIGLVFDFRFRFFTGQITFFTTDWFIPDDPVNTFFLYLDKIDYIKYGDFTSPVFLNVGKNPTTTLGTGFLVKNFHNHAFLPVSREWGLMTKFNCNYLNKFKADNFPFDATLIISDLLDPDLFILDTGLDILKLIKLNDNFSFRIGQILATDVNTTESNRLSSLSRDEDEITSHRNLSTTDYNHFTSFPLFLSYYTDYVWKHDLVKVNGFGEFVSLFDFASKYSSFNYGFGIKLGTEAVFINLPNSGYLLGTILGFIIESPHYTLDYFGPNYEVVRTKQYLDLYTDPDYTFYITTGFAIYAFDEKIKFRAIVTIPFEAPFSMKISASFVLEDTLVKGLYAELYYETGVNPFTFMGYDFITDDFRFSANFGYKFFGVKIAVLLGVQKPAWVGSYFETQDQYAKELQKFVSLEISFVL